MHAICLLKADFNFYNKLIFARRMMSSAQSKGQIPVECFATKGNNCIKAVITKMMLCDESRTHHHPTCIGGNDFGACYNRIAHPPASIALQSWGISRKAVWVLLIAMRMMRFFLHTGFGESSETYGGSKEDSTLGLGQGNAAAGAGYIAVSSLIINAYLREGHGLRTTTSLTCRIFNIAAVIYVDNADLPHMTTHVMASPAELIQHSQKSTNAWGGLGIATGAALKPAKCYAYFLVYWYPNGCVSMGNVLTLPEPTAHIAQDDGPPLPSNLTVPLPDGTPTPIPTLPPTTASLMLGIWFGPAFRGTKHMAEMCKKGFTWADKLHAHPLIHSQAWTSFSPQLYPGMLWGLSTVVLSTHKFYEATRPVYFKCLPLLGMQRHIELPWHTLPEAYQGISLPNFSLHLLAAKLQLIQCLWGFSNAALLSLTMGYKSFLMEVGLYGNTLSYNYKLFAVLATDNTGSRTFGNFSMTSTFMHHLMKNTSCTLFGMVIIC